MAISIKQAFDIDELLLKLASGIYNTSIFATKIGQELRRVGMEATSEAAGLMSAEDKARLSSIINPTQDLTGPGAASIETRTTFLTPTDSAEAISLADGVFSSQRKTIVGRGYAGPDSSIITPTSFADGISVTLNNDFDGVELEWDGVDWRLVSLYNTAVLNT